MIKRRVEITVETQQILVFRRPGRREHRLWCEGCLRDTTMLTPDEAATACSVSTRIIYRWVEAGRLHFRERLEEPMLVCLDSLMGLTAQHAPS